MPVTIGKIGCSLDVYGTGSEVYLTVMECYLQGRGIVDRRTEERYRIPHAVIAAEPEQQGVVFGFAARKVCRLQLNGITIGSQRYSLWTRPTQSFGKERGTGSQVAEFLTLVLVHRIVISQAVFVAREVTEMRVADLRGRKRFGPDTRLHHVTVEERCAINRRTDTENRGIVLKHPTR